MSDLSNEAFDRLYQEMMDFIDDHFDMDEEELLDRLYEKFPPIVISTFTAAMTGFAPSTDEDELEADLI